MINRWPDPKRGSRKCYSFSSKMWIFFGENVDSVSSKIWIGAAEGDQALTRCRRWRVFVVDDMSLSCGSLQHELLDVIGFGCLRGLFSVISVDFLIGFDFSINVDEILLLNFSMKSTKLSSKMNHLLLEIENQKTHLGIWNWVIFLQNFWFQLPLMFWKIRELNWSQIFVERVPEPWHGS